MIRENEVKQPASRLGCPPGSLQAYDLDPGPDGYAFPTMRVADLQPVREAASYRGLFTAGWVGVREKHYSQLEIYDRLRASEQAAGPSCHSPPPCSLEQSCFVLSLFPFLKIV